MDTNPNLRWDKFSWLQISPKRFFSFANFSIVNVSKKNVKTQKVFKIEEETKRFLSLTIFCDKLFDQKSTVHAVPVAAGREDKQRQTNKIGIQQLRVILFYSLPKFST